MATVITPLEALLLPIASGLLVATVQMYHQSRIEKKKASDAIVAKETLAKETLKEKQELVNKQLEINDDRTAGAINKLSGKVVEHVVAFQAHVNNDERAFSAQAAITGEIKERLVAVETTLVSQATTLATQGRTTDRIEQKLDRVIERHA